MIKNIIIIVLLVAVPQTTIADEPNSTEPTSSPESEPILIECQPFPECAQNKRGNNLKGFMSEIIIPFKQILLKHEKSKDASFDEVKK